MKRTNKFGGCLAKISAMLMFIGLTCIPSLPSMYKLRSSLIFGESKDCTSISVFPSMGDKQPNFSCRRLVWSYTTCVQCKVLKTKGKKKITLDFQHRNSEYFLKILGNILLKKCILIMSNLES